MRHIGTIEHALVHVAFKRVHLVQLFTLRVHLIYRKYI